MRHKLPLIALLAVLPIACSPELSNNEYSTARPGEMSSRVIMGRVTAVRPVKVRTGERGDRALVGGGGGALAGGLLGAAIGSGSDSAGTGALVGALAGGLGGAAIGHATGSSDAWEITVITDGGETITSISKERLYKDMRVEIRIPLGGGRVRFLPIG